MTDDLKEFKKRFGMERFNFYPTFHGIVISNKGFNGYHINRPIPKIQTLDTLNVFLEWIQDRLDSKLFKFNHPPVTIFNDEDIIYLNNMEEAKEYFLIKKLARI